MIPGGYPPPIEKPEATERYRSDSHQKGRKRDSSARGVWLASTAVLLVLAVILLLALIPDV